MLKKQKAFTLVELVIVILILGILAAIAVPKFFSTSDVALDNGLKMTLGTVRDAIELYQAENGELPGQADDLPGDLTDYIRGTFPSCPVGDATVPTAVEYTNVDAPLAGEATPAEGWHFNKVTGEFIINFNGVSRSDANFTYDQF